MFSTYFNRMILTAFIFCFGIFAEAAPPSLNYQGRILKSDGTPLTYPNVSFIFQIKGGSNGQCLIYQEQVNGIDLSGSGGVFDVPIGMGAIQYPTGGNFTVLDAFNNSTTLACGTCSGTTCSASGTNFTPVVEDIRYLKVQFYDGSGWRSITPESIIRSVPFAGYSLSAQKLGTHAATDFVLKSDVNNSGTGSVSCDSGNFLTWNASTQTFGCAGVSGASGGTVTNVTSANSYLSVANGSAAPVLTVNVGTTAGTVTAGNDSRLVNALQSGSAAGGDLSGTYPNPSVVAIYNTPVQLSALSSNHYLKYNGAKWINAAIAIADVTGLSTTLAGVVQQSQFPASCAANQTLTFISPSSSFTCSAIAINGSQVSGNISGSAAGFTGSLVGDVSGTQGATSVDKIKGVGVDFSTAPTSNQVLTFNGTNWAPANLPAAVSSQWITSGTDIYYNTGNVGIGTSTPGMALDVVGDLRSSTAIYAPIGYLTRTLNQTNVAASPSYSFIYSGDTGMFEAGGAGSHKIGFSTSGAERVRIDDLGNVGIGMTTPAYKLDVAGDINVTGNFKVNGVNIATGGGTVTNVSSANADIAVASGSSTPILTLNSGTGANQIVKLDGSGKLATSTLPSTALTTASTLSGDVSGTSSTTTVDKIKGTSVSATPTSTGQVLRYSGTTWTPNFVSMADLRSTITGASALTSCANNQTLTWSAATDNLACSNISLPAGQITGTLAVNNGGTGVTATSQGTVFAGPVSGTGAPNFRALASTDLPTGTLSGSGTSGYVPYYSAASTLANSGIYYSGGNVGIGTTSPLTMLDVVTPANVASGVHDLSRIGDGTNSIRLGFLANGTSVTSSYVRADSNLPLSLCTTSTCTSGGGITLLNSGNVGIGTTTPLGNLEVASEGNQTHVFATSASSVVLGSSNFIGTRSRGTLAARTHLNSGDRLATFLGTSGVTNSSWTGMQIYATEAHTASAQGKAIQFFTTANGGTTDTNKMTIDHNGNVGIGTSSPASPLNVIGNSPSATPVLLESYGTSGNPVSGFTGKVARGTASSPTATQAGDGVGMVQSTYGVSTWVNNAAIYLRVAENQSETNRGSYITFDTTPLGSPGRSERMRIDSNGYVGIGTTTPSQLLQVSSSNTSATYIGLTNTSASGRDWLIGSTGTLNGQGAGRLAFWDNTAGVSRMVIDPSGGVGIGTTTPSGRLHVKGPNANMTGAPTNSIAMFESGSSANTDYLAIGSPAEDVMSIQVGDQINTRSLALNPQGGNVGIGTTTPGYRLDVNGTIRGFGITDSSDLRLKHDVQPLQNDLDKILKLQGVSYYWNDSDTHGTRKQVGVIAQDVEKIYPELVETDDQGMKSVNYSHLVAPLIEAVKTLYNHLRGVEDAQLNQAREVASKADKAEVEALRAENAKLKARLDKIEKMLNESGISKWESTK